MTRHLGTLGSIARVKYITPLHLYAAILPLPSQLVFERRNATGELPQFAAEAEVRTCCGGGHECLCTTRECFIILSL